MDFYRSMVMEQGGIMDNIEEPRIVAIDSMVDHVRSLQAPITFDALVEWVCVFKRVVKTWLFGGRENVRVSIATTANNKKYRELYTRFLQRIQHAECRVIITSMKPLTVVWQTAKTPEVVASNDGGGGEREKDVKTRTESEAEAEAEAETEAEVSAPPPSNLSSDIATPITTARYQITYLTQLTYLTRKKVLIK